MVLTVVAAIIGFTIYRYVKNRKNGGTACNCSSASTCGKSRSSCGINEQ